MSCLAHGLGKLLASSDKTDCYDKVRGTTDAPHGLCKTELRNTLSPSPVHGCHARLSNPELSVVRELEGALHIPQAWGHTPVTNRYFDRLPAFEWPINGLNCYAIPLTDRIVQLLVPRTWHDYAFISPLSEPSASVLRSTRCGLLGSWAVANEAAILYNPI
jgi:hypothetical protein